MLATWMTFKNIILKRKNPVTEGCLLCDYTYIKHPENASMELGFSDQRVTVYGCKVSLQGDGNVLYLDWDDVCKTLNFFNCTLKTGEEWLLWYVDCISIKYSRKIKSLHSWNPYCEGDVKGHQSRVMWGLGGCHIKKLCSYSQRGRRL